jgi:transposase
MQCYSISGMTKWLKAHNVRHKKPHGVPAKANKEAQDAFIAEYQALIEKTKGKEPLYFIDSTHPQHHTQRVHGWIPCGMRKEIPTTGQQRRMNIIGGVCLEGYKVLFHEDQTIHSESIQCFLKKLRRQHPDRKKVHIIWDNASCHCCKKVKRLAKMLRIIIHYLPPYSPNLNPIERLWKMMHECVHYNRYYQKFSAFKAATLKFLKTIGRRNMLLGSRLTDNFRAIGIENFAF